MHYSKPKGFVGRSICYAIKYNNLLYGFIVGGSATKHLPNRDKFIGTDAALVLNNIVNNIFFHVERVNGRYPVRNFVPKIILEWERRVRVDWENKYGDRVVAFESLVEPPRTGDSYLRAGWTRIGITKGYTCRRSVDTYFDLWSGKDLVDKDTESWSGKRLWDKKNLRPKLIFMKMTNGGRDETVV